MELCVMALCNSLISLWQHVPRAAPSSNTLTRLYCYEVGITQHCKMSMRKQYTLSILLYFHLLFNIINMGL